MGIRIAVCGSRKYADVKQLHRALDAIHRKHFIRSLVTGDQGGAEEMAYFWAVNRHIAEIITVPATLDLLGKFCRERRANHLLAEYAPAVVVGFSYPRADCLIYVAESRGFKVWEVPRDFR